MNELLKEAMNRTNTLNNIYFVNALNWDIDTIQHVHEYAKSQNIDDKMWLPSVIIWLRLNFAIESISVKLPITEDEFDELKQLAIILNITDNKWEKNIEIVKRPVKRSKKN
jgi:hypothetical protein